MSDSMRQQLAFPDAGQQVSSFFIFAMTLTPYKKYLNYQYNQIYLTGMNLSSIKKIYFSEICILFRTSYV